jgi:hypothetical protein
MKKLYTFWLLIAAMFVMATFSNCSTAANINPADMKFKKQTVNGHKSMNKMKLRKCNKW